MEKGGIIGMRKFFRSNQFMLTMEQLTWIEKQSNASHLIRTLIEIAMSCENFENDYIGLEFIEKRIATLKQRIANKQYRTVLDLATAKVTLEEEEERRKKLLAELL